MNRKLADTIVLDFTVHLPTTGAVSDADALPTVEVWEDETDTTLSGGTVTKRVGKTGNYRVAVVATTGNGFEVGKSYNVVVTVVAGGVTAKAVIGSFFIDSKRLADLNDLAAGSAMTLTSAYDAAKVAAPESGGNVAAIKAKTDNLPADPASNTQVNTRLATSGYTAPDNSGISAIKTKTDNLPADPAATGDIPTAAAIADQVWDEAIADHLGAGSTGNALNAAGSAGDPWSTPIPGAYGAGTAGKIVGDNVNATISSRSTLTAQQVWEYATRTLSSFGTLVADIATAVWASVTRSLTDKAGFTISGTKTTLDALQDLSQAGAQAGATAALNAYDPPTRAEATSDKAELAALTARVIAALTNRLVVNPATGAYTIYADDGVTPLVTGTISGTGRSAPTWP
ncbi:MAG: hypothetical protein FJ121_08870 [Deltaproteobacteria bacterium]|nr:hypothetical protein [Deltaproteobacteria bacterium]